MHFAVVTFSVLANAKSVDEQVEAFASGGQKSFTAQYSRGKYFHGCCGCDKGGNRKRRISRRSMEESEEYNEKDDNSDVQVGLNMTSVEKDLKNQVR